MVKKLNMTDLILICIDSYTDKLSFSGTMAIVKSQAVKCLGNHVSFLKTTFSHFLQKFERVELPSQDPTLVKLTLFEL